MNKQRKYTAQEMREKVKSIEQFPMMGLELTSKEKLELAAMLSQAADAEDDLRTMRSTWLTPETSKALFNDCVSKTSDLADLKARLEAVVKECEKMRDDFSKRMRSFTGMFAQNMKNIYADKIEIVDDILRTARGEESAQQQA